MYVLKQNFASSAATVTYAEEWNEYHHLLIMESLGGDQRWVDRFLGFHSAIVYYITLLLLWSVSPAIAYNFSELIEAGGARLLSSHKKLHE